MSGVKLDLVRRCPIALTGLLTSSLAACLAQPGAPTPDVIPPDTGHWSFRAPTSPAIPAVKNQSWVRNPIDAFVLAKLEAAPDLAPSPEADASALARRVSLDLTGLPAVPGDEALDYDALVDRLLASPHYGEHLAREWLDAARYGDTHGYHIDLDRPTWPWRDYVITAFNTNMPFDRFTIEQLAGDLLADASEDQVLATAFIRNHPITQEGGVLDDEFRILYGVDRVSTVGSVWLGLTIGCARCHDHKYDPLSQRDFYSLLDCFNHFPENGDGGANDFAPRTELFGPIARDRKTAIDQKLAELDAAMTAPQVGEDKARWRAGIGDPTISWHDGQLLEMHSEYGSTLTALDDHSVLASGENPSIETYDLIFDVDVANIRAIRLEAITDPSLPHNGPGRAPNGNFALTELEAFLETDRGASRIELSEAFADLSQYGLPVANAIDGRGGTSWAIEGGIGNPHTAIFTAVEPFGDAPRARVRVRLRCDWGDSHLVGRFRLAFSSDPLAGLGLFRLASAPAPAVDEYYLMHFAAIDVRAKALEALHLQREKDLFTRIPRVLIAVESDARETFVLERGQYDHPLEPVNCRAPLFLPPFAEGSPKNRLGLAEWLVSPENPLTARVIVNRYWRMIFGRGLVDTVNDFGTRGEIPTNQQLLDWLAVEFIRSGWDVKALFRTIVTSATYRQASASSAEALARDPSNASLARGPRAPLFAEELRDQALFVAGLLVEDVGGPSVFPRQPPGLWEELNNRANQSMVHRADVGARAHRRSVYTYWKRTSPPPLMSTLDAPARDLSVVKREHTNTALQALALLHEPQLIEAARALAERMLLDANGDPATAIARGFELLFLREPTLAETGVLFRLYQTEREAMDPAAALGILRIGDAPRNSPFGNETHAAMTQVARALLNSSEALTKE